MTLAAHIFLRTGVRPSVVLVEAPAWERHIMLEAMRQSLKALAAAKAAQERNRV